jgi:hypothetical protein
LPRTPTSRAGRNHAGQDGHCQCGPEQSGEPRLSRLLLWSDQTRTCERILEDSQRSQPTCGAENLHTKETQMSILSWWCDGEKDTIWIQYMNGTHIEANMTAWRDSVNVALMILNGQTKDNTNGSLYYYAHNLVYPTGQKNFKR